MNLLELLFFLLVGWTLLGVVGLLVARARRERDRLRTGLPWIIAVWVLYFIALIATSLRQPQKVIAVGQRQCFRQLCYAVIHVEDVPRFLGRNNPGDGSRLVRVSIGIKNIAHNGARRDSSMQVYLVDQQGRHWAESRGINGNGLTARIDGGAEIISEPVFKVPADATSLSLVFTHGFWQYRNLVIGDSDSIFHRRTIVPLSLPAH